MDYEYQCKVCTRKFSVSHAMGEIVKVKCPDCGSMEVYRKWSAPSVIYKTGGFYTTDHKK